VFLVTTSHRPSQRLRSFIKDLTLILPGSLRVNRGKRRLADLAYLALANNKKYVIVVDRWRGNPSLIRIYTLNMGGGGDLNLVRYADIALAGVRLSREGGLKLAKPVTGYREVDYSKCSSDKCLELSGLLTSLLREFLGKHPGYRLVVGDEKNIVTIKLMTENERDIGPLIKVRGFKVYGKQG